MIHDRSEESKAGKLAAVLGRIQDRGSGLGRPGWRGWCGPTFGLHESQLYAWRKKARYEASRSGAEKELAAENVRLERQAAKQAEELAI